MGSLLQMFFGSVIAIVTAQEGILYPRASESRTVVTLDGVWSFRADTQDVGFKDNWYLRPLKETGSVMDMPVPSSYNDVGTDKALRDFVGTVWYETNFFVPPEWKDRVVALRFGSVHYNAVVWLNGQDIMSHIGGHLPFEANINFGVNFTSSNRLTVAVDNRLTPITLPPGQVVYQNDTNRFPKGYVVQELQMDFFNYAGIHRHVHLYTKPTNNVDDIDIITDIQGTDGVVNYTISCTDPGVPLKVEVVNADGVVVASSSKYQDRLVIPKASFWWPWTMAPDNVGGYLYTLQIKAQDDVYRQPFGIRTVKVTSQGFLINDKPFYCHGVAKHEDSDIRGKGLDYPLITRDFNMLKWLGVNCFRTSHYPYAEEILDMADRVGIAVIDESPGVGIKANNMGPENLKHHKIVMDEMVRRDKNRPSVIMWSVANEPESEAFGAEDYFGPIINLTRQLDPSKRPVTFVSDKDYNTDRVVQFVDVICINRYIAWYSDTGHTEVISHQLSYDFDQWRKAYPDKPIIVTEYGADTVPGLHTDPSFVFTEDYQVDFMMEYHKVFDKYKTQFLTGEMVWNFADFMTVQSPTRVVGNKKGVLTRQREPKESGHLLRDRYYSIFNSTYAATKSYLYRSRQEL